MLNDLQKVCTSCESLKDLSEFHNNASRSDGKASYCKPCNRVYNKPKTKEQSQRDSKKYLLAHPEKRKQILANYYAANREKILAKRAISDQRPERKERYRMWYEKYKPIQAAKQRERRKNFNPKQKLSKALRDRFSKVVIRMKKGVKWCSWRDLIGCTVDELRTHLESQFVAGMNWDNHGNGVDKWNIDHIKPLVKFNLFILEEQLKAFHYTNLRPLWFEQNMARNRKNHSE